jgi:hypothetical protein
VQFFLFALHQGLERPQGRDPAAQFVEQLRAIPAQLLDRDWRTLFVSFLPLQEQFAYLRIGAHGDCISVWSRRSSL